MAATKLKRERAAAAAAALLGIAPAVQAAKTTAAEPPPTSDRWTWDTSFLQYNESERIGVSEPQIGVRHDYADGRALSVLATVDVISGATPLGTLPATKNTATNVVTGPSGRVISSDIGKVPTSHMADTRIALSSSYERPMGSQMNGIFGGSVAKEHDFLSLGANGTFNRDFNQKNTTLSFGLSPEFDQVKPNGGLPYAYGPYQAAGEFEGTSKTKYLIGGLIGLTQVINRQTLMQWNYSPTYENGYLNDPYKLLSLTNTQGDPLSAIHEKRPGSRFGQSFYWLTRYNLRLQDVASMGLRYYADNWGVHSQTIDFTYRWQYDERHFWEPHVRYYHQQAADFFRVGLLQGQPLPDFSSADYRLNSIDSVTFGLSYGWTFLNGTRLMLRAEYYIQTGDDSPRSAVGAQRYFDLFPTLNASILQITYSFEPSQLWSKKK